MEKHLLCDTTFSYYNQLFSFEFSWYDPFKTYICCPNPLKTKTKVPGIMGENIAQLKNSLSKHCYFDSDQCWQCCLVISICAKTLTSKMGEGWIYKTESRTESFSVQHLHRPGKHNHQFCSSNERLSSSCQLFNHQPAPWPEPWQHKTAQPTNEQAKPGHSKTILNHFIVETVCYTPYHLYEIPGVTV